MCGWVGRVCLLFWKPVISALRVAGKFHISENMFHSEKTSPVWTRELCFLFFVLFCFMSIANTSQSQCLYCGKPAKAVIWVNLGLSGSQERKSLKTWEAMSLLCIYVSVVLYCDKRINALFIKEHLWLQTSLSPVFFLGDKERVQFTLGLEKTDS